jgi:CRISPR/Cas system-associated exonuclease Cas4 (RecB family)
MAYRQCPRRLWLEVHHPELRVDPAASAARFAVGDLVGALARSLYDPEDNGVLIDVEGAGPEAGITATAETLERRVPIFEAGLEGGGARAFVDVLRPVRRGSQRSWELIEVKSSASLKGSHHDDLAIQTYVALAAGLPLAAARVAHIDTRFTYPGHDDYQGLLREIDLTSEVLSRRDEVAQWVRAGQSIVAQVTPPEVATGWQCRSPYPCAYLRHCRSQEPPAKFPLHVLPRLQGELRRQAEAAGWRDLRELPDERLSPLQLRVKQQTLRDEIYFDRAGAAADLHALPAPAVFLDFEAVQLAIPIWPGSHPYQMFPFQFSLHVLAADGSLTHHDYLDLSGAEPGRAFAEQLLAGVPGQGTIFVWNATFELARIGELARRFADLRPALTEMAGRVVDLLHITESRYYHPAQGGSWKLKRVLPTLPGSLDYGDLTGVQDGHLAMLAYVEAIQLDTLPERRAQLKQQLLDYCRLDTLALVHIWRFLAGVPEV